MQLNTAKKLFYISLLHSALQTVKHYTSKVLIYPADSKISKS
jgi:hypothetical protein